ncbi:glycosyl hydrolase [Kiritimatiella glycovorans]|uniref:Beta-xylosidase n=1 Tax=Kiritimatiella glycovorans TaxID=1307763 RepID=A0A0G3EL33_9BACT|nr:glycosyl hydrolase [Kiritimatiella glycovorans]AKJ65475.1 Beta-xylosidase [Kiritimatiella glycovorans]
MKKRVFLTALAGTCAVVLTARAGGRVTEADGIDPAGFADPPVTARAMVYWDWINGNVNRAAITRDLEHMKAVGLGGGLLFDIPNLHQHDPGYVRPGPVAFMSEEWLDLVHFAAEESQRLGLDFGIVLCCAWNTGGPWIGPEDNNQLNASAEMRVSGPRKGPLKLPDASVDPRYKDIAVVAWPTPDRMDRLMHRHSPEILINGEPGDASISGRMMDGNRHNAASVPAPEPERPVTVEFVFDRPVTADGLYIQENPRFGVRTGRIEARVDGAYSPAARFSTDGYSPVKVSFEPVTARRFRLVVTDAQPIAAARGELRLYEVQLLKPGSWSPDVPAPRNFALKRGYFNARGMHRGGDPLPARHLAATPAAGRIPALEPRRTTHLTARLNGDDTLDWRVPEGEWTILRFGMTPAYAHTYNAGGRAGNEGALEADKMSAAAIRKHYEAMGEAILQHLSPRGREALDFFHVDSWEQEGNLWTGAFLDEFRKRRGYDLTPYLPVLEGRIVKDALTTDRVLWDYRRTIGDLHIHNHFAELAALCHEHGIRLSAQSGHFFQANMDTIGSVARADYPSGEFWNRGRESAEPDLRNTVRDAASAANVYNRDFTLIESYTCNQWHRNWISPLDMKKQGDYAFSEGVRRMFIHGLWMDPEVGNRPIGFSWGPTGIDVGPDITWMPDGRPFFDYLARCQYLLQAGVVDNDVLYFYGDGFPNITPRRDELPLALPTGRDYDAADGRAIRERARVEDGMIIMPHGATYRVLLLPPRDTMLPETLEAVYRLVRRGAIVVGPKPLRSPSLSDQPRADAVIQELTDRLWGPDPEPSGSKRTGRGRVHWGVELAAVFEEHGIPPQVKIRGAGEAEIAHVHRRMGDGREVYFLANRSGRGVELEAAFRNTGGTPCRWDPGTGARFRLQSVGEDAVRVDLPPWGSTFVVFDPHAGELPREPSTSVEDRMVLSGPWRITFQENRGAPAEYVFDELKSWTEANRPGIRYFSGYGTYHKEFELEDPVDGKTYTLDLGDVGDVAHVKLNGHDLGTRWKPPFRVDLTDAVRNGKNRLEIAVVNTWMNRLVGDAQFPPDKAIVNTFVRGEIPESEYGLEKFPSGLLGPVAVEVRRAQKNAPLEYGMADPNASLTRMPDSVRPLLDTFMRDPQVCAGPDGWYYMTGTTEAPGMDPWHINDGIRLWKSRDLKHWTPMGLVWDLDEARGWQRFYYVYDKDGSTPGRLVAPEDLTAEMRSTLRVRRAVWAPEIHYLKSQGTFFLTACINHNIHLPREQWAGHKHWGATFVLRSTSGRADGPYVDPHPSAPLTGGIDSSLFEDDDGTVYLACQGSSIARFREDMSGLAEGPWDPRETPFPREAYAEGAFLFKARDRYRLVKTYWSFAEGDRFTYAQHPAPKKYSYDPLLATADSIRGPYGPRHNTITGGGHGNFFCDHQGRWWACVFFNPANKLAGNERYACRPALVRMQWVDDRLVVDREANDAFYASREGFRISE